ECKEQHQIKIACAAAMRREIIEDRITLLLPRLRSRTPRPCPTIDLTIAHPLTVQNLLPIGFQHIFITSKCFSRSIPYKSYTGKIISFNNCLTAVVDSRERSFLSTTA